jgi:16S rRNA (guanine(966)-N(2))-methyltransferase RsmD
MSGRVSLRIIGGRSRGRRLRAPVGKGVRPTGDRVREALFNIWGQRFDGLRFLDVCAGTGVVSLEALSRYAAEVVAIEKDSNACRSIRDEAERMGHSPGLDVRCGDARVELRRLRQEGVARFDAAFVDPPWEDVDLRREILWILLEAPPLCRSAAVESPGKADPPPAPPGALLSRTVRHGATTLLYYDDGGVQAGRAGDAERG